MKTADKLGEYLCGLVFACAHSNAASEVVFLFLNVERSFFHHIQDFAGAFNEELPRWRERKFMLVTVEKLDAQRCFQLHELPA